MWETSAEVDRFIHGRRRPPDRAFHKQIFPEAPRLKRFCRHVAEREPTRLKRAVARQRR
jgi:hypothetical protein